jgi:hypothetical protein
VVDGDISKPFPLNYICNLHKDKDYYAIERQASIPTFTATFGLNRQDLALELLNKALLDPQYSSDPDIVKELKERISILTEKTKIEAVCEKCHKTFQYQQRKKPLTLCGSCRAELALFYARTITRDKRFRGKPSKRLCYISKTVINDPQAQEIFGQN